MITDKTQVLLSQFVALASRMRASPLARCLRYAAHSASLNICVFWLTVYSEYLGGDGCVWVPGPPPAALIWPALGCCSCSPTVTLSLSDIHCCHSGQDWCCPNLESGHLLIIIIMFHSCWAQSWSYQDWIEDKILNHVPLLCVHNTAQWKFHKSCTHTVQSLAWG